MADQGRDEMLQSLYHHIVLPREVPGREDSNLSAIESELLDRLTGAVKALLPNIPLRDQHAVDTVRRALTTAKTLNAGGRLDRQTLAKELHELEGNSVLILHVTEQNAGVLVYRDTAQPGGDDNVIFEVFEASAESEQVLAAKNALQWDFPGQAVAVPFHAVSNESFQEALASFLERASDESVAQFSAVTYKAAAPLPEIRDTSSPALISGTVMSILKANGKVYASPILRKRVRDTVSFRDARKPWRRSPFYLVLRVALQRHFYRLLGAEIGQLYYKCVMCLFMESFLDEALLHLPHEASNYLKSKLGRRLAKLERDQSDVLEATRTASENLLLRLCKVFKTTLTTAGNYHQSQWETHIQPTNRPIRTLPQRAAVSDLKLRLPLSGTYLSQRLANPPSNQHTSSVRVAPHETSKPEVESFTGVLKQLYELVEFEDFVYRMDVSDDQEQRIIDFASMLSQYSSKVGQTLSKYPELKSEMLLNMMELWSMMDQEAVSCYTLLRDYHPGFEVNLLDALCLLSLDDMKRLRRVQSHIAKRCQAWSGCGSKTIFAKPAADSFAVRYYSESPDFERFQEIHRQIEIEARQMRAAKEEEWNTATQHHEDLSQEIATASCTAYEDVDEFGRVIRRHRNCQKHRAMWERKKMQIQLFEHPLPDDDSDAKATVFELACPKALLDYRDATWKILTSFFYQPATRLENVPLIRQYSGLQQYVRWNSEVSLGSSTKSHLKCHYATSGFPVALEDVIRPLAMTLDYFDSSSKNWLHRAEKPSLAAQFPLMLPRESAFQSLNLSFESWPSSNRILASQSKCPADLAVQEFIEWQALLTGTHCRWMSLLRELGSTNLDFSTESTWTVVSQLILQVGPSSSPDDLRDIHAVFHDSHFSKALFRHVFRRLRAICHNWREPIQMDLLISMLLKCESLSPSPGIRELANRLLEFARSITWDWQRLLKDRKSKSDIWSAETNVLAIWASVLCKRTFYRRYETDTKIVFNPGALKYWIASSISLKESLIGKFTALPSSLQNTLLQDLRCTYRLRDSIAKAILCSDGSFFAALSETWPLPQGVETSVSVGIQNEWLNARIQVEDNNLHKVQFHIVSGLLLIDGQQRGVLPNEYRQWPAVERLFGSQKLHIRPSPLPGMTLVLQQCQPYNHWIHFGPYNGARVIQANHNGRLLEYIPHDIFHNEYRFDLPLPLVEGCYHWLDRTANTVEIRQGNPWKSKKRSWQLNIRTRCLTKGGVMLVDPNSALFSMVSKNFVYFEYPPHIMVYQSRNPKGGNVRVQLKRLELEFVVNDAGLLQSSQLGAVIAETAGQDAGTWHGLRSKLVIRSIGSSRQRSILVPRGPFKVTKDGQHVRMFIMNTGSYMRFDINDVLGRIECPAEPRLLYWKALLHAYTSHFLPDSLTGRTGTDEALFHLRSALCQPWTSLSSEAITLLRAIAALTPARVYYPPNLKRMEVVRWNAQLTTFIQDDRYRATIESICQRAADLSKFSSSPSPPIGCPQGNIHLEVRAQRRSYVNDTAKGLVYRSRDGEVSTDDQQETFSLSKLLSDWPAKVPSIADVASLLQKYPVIGGYSKEFDKVRITDLLCINIGEYWGPLARLATHSSFEDRYKLMFLFGPMAGSSGADADLIRAIVACAILPDFESLTPPAHAAYFWFHADQAPKVEHLARIARTAIVPFWPNSEVMSSQRLRQLLEEHNFKTDAECTRFAESLLMQWPDTTLTSSIMSHIDKTYLDVDQALELVHPEWTRLSENLAFSQHVQEVQAILDRHSVEEMSSDAPWQHAQSGISAPSTEVSPRYPTRSRGSNPPTLQSLLQRDLASVGVAVEAPKQPVMAVKRGPGRRPATHSSGPSVTPELQELVGMATRLEHSLSSVRSRYGVELQQSIQAFSKLAAKPERHPRLEWSTEKQRLEAKLIEAKHLFHERLQRIRETFKQNEPGATWLSLAGAWPGVTVVTLLHELRSTSNVKLGRGVKEALVELGLSITFYQRLLRVQYACEKNKKQVQREELENRGHRNWSPYDQPDWLLLEIEGDILLRPEQVNVARATISPSSNQNSVVQLLMGKGKTSCILPMVALELANKRSVMRVVVPRALLLQSAEVIQAKLGGLLNRQILHLPFSRRTPTDSALLQVYYRLHKHIREQRGVLITLPEHILSFKLSGLQRLCNGEYDKADSMLRVQDWLQTHARDVLDECDVSLAIRTQLIYPSGSQMTVDGHPLRWQAIQMVLRLVQSYLPELQASFPRGIEIVPRSSGEFPLVYFGRADVEEALIMRLVDSICDGHTPILSSANIPAAAQDDIKVFISTPKVTVEVAQHVVEAFKDEGHLLGLIYLLRGLFVHRILLSTLKKRWNVQYGLAPDRDPMAVPYLAKGVPSPAAEWGHPDVAIILTCLSFYYQGLDVSQFKQAFERLLKSDDPSIDYVKWIASGVPEGLRDYNSINVQDSVQLDELHKHIKHNVYLLDFYMNFFVFPRYAKQFATKLQASGWDLVLHSPVGKQHCQTTGFSGTNDTRHQLPLTIRQNDLPRLSHTNAEVLFYLLAPRNRHYVHMVDDADKRFTEDELLKTLHSPSKDKKAVVKARIRILIDAGAQILEHDNRSLAKLWLTIDREAEAAVYFGDDHRAQVIYRKGSELPLVSTPFAENLDGCLVYLDESHCRGTDLKLPTNARAALTLGPHLTKDALVQAAMRLRLLGQSQSVTFFAPTEVHQKIIDLRTDDDGSPVDSSHVISWLLEQTCNAMEQLEPLYFNQGRSYLQHIQAKLDYPHLVHDETSRKSYLGVMRLKEMQTLKGLYEPRHLQRDAGWAASISAHSLRGSVLELRRRRRNFQDTGIAVHSSTLEEVEIEQEREVEYEVETVREVQKPVHYRAHYFSGLHYDIKEFALSGRLPLGSDGYLPMPLALKNTALGHKHSESTSPVTVSSLFVSSQHMRTVAGAKPNDNFLRPCQWVVWSCSTSVALIVTLEEADLLIPILRGREESSGTHLIVYAAPVTRQMLYFNKLDYYAVPPLPRDFEAPMWLKCQLGIFAGRLYFEWEEYKAMLQYLGVDPESEGEQDRGIYTKKPLIFLHEWLALRRKGQKFEHTPMGFLSTGKPLSPDHPLFQTSPVDNMADIGSKLSSANIHSDESSSDDSEDDEEDDEYDDRHDDDYDPEKEKFYDAGERQGGHDGEDNAFFQGPEYTEDTQNVEGDAILES